MRTEIALGLALAVATLCGAGAQERQSPFGGFRHDSTLPIEITADALEVRQAEARAIFTGDVVAGQGDLRLTAQTLSVWYAAGGTSGGSAGGSAGAGAADGGAIDRLRAEGAVFLSSGAESARGEWAEYSVSTGLITMGGGVVLAQGENAIRGERLTVDLTTGQGRVEGGRVQSVFNPASRSGQ